MIHGETRRDDEQRLKSSFDVQRAWCSGITDKGFYLFTLTDQTVRLRILPRACEQLGIIMRACRWSIAAPQTLHIAAFCYTCPEIVPVEILQ